MNIQKIMLYAGYTVSVLFFLLGGTVLAGVLFPPEVPAKFRIMFGTVLVLYGIYRFVTLRVKQQQKDEDSSIQ